MNDEDRKSVLALENFIKKTKGNKTLRFCLFCHLLSSIQKTDKPQSTKLFSSSVSVEPCDLFRIKVRRSYDPIAG